MNIPGFLAELAIVSKSNMVTSDKSYETWIRTNNVIVLQETPTGTGTGGQQTCNAKETPCCSDSAKTCRCESISSCFEMGKICKEKGYTDSYDTNTAVICTAPFTQSTGGIHVPLTGSVISRL
jgi:hypothetical protein